MAWAAKHQLLAVPCFAHRSRTAAVATLARLGKRHNAMEWIGVELDPRSQPRQRRNHLIRSFQSPGICDSDQRRVDDRTARDPVDGALQTTSASCAPGTC